MLLNYISYLPDDIITIIWDQINPSYKIFINKQNYIQFNNLIDKRITRYESYIKDIIRLDYSYVFKYLLTRNLTTFLKITNYKYSNITYVTYIHFIHDFCKINKSYKCYEILNLQLDLSKLKKKHSKLNKIKDFQWIN
jgi:hypothetical protein